jgi:peptide deformylase
MTFDGKPAFIASHEIDHLDGILFIDKKAGKHENRVTS